MIWMNGWCFAQNKGEKVERQWIKRKDNICFEVRAPSSTSPPSPPWRISNPLRSTELLSQPYNATEAIQPQIHLYRRGIRPVANKQSPLLTRRSKHKSPPLPKREQTNHPINLYQGGIQQKQGCLQLGGYNNLKQSLFHKTKILID